MAFKIYGKIMEKESKKGVAGLIVEAMDKDSRVDDSLGSVVTDKDGNFEIIYDKKDFKDHFLDKKPDIYLRFKDSMGNVIHTTKSKVRYRAGKTEKFNIKI